MTKYSNNANETDRTVNETSINTDVVWKNNKEYINYETKKMLPNAIYAYLTCAPSSSKQTPNEADPVKIDKSDTAEIMILKFRKESRHCTEERACDISAIILCTIACVVCCANCFVTGGIENIVTGFASILLCAVFVCLFIIMADNAARRQNTLEAMIQAILNCQKPKWLTTSSETERGTAREQSEVNSV